jgi:hypothetical protein
MNQCESCRKLSDLGSDWQWTKNRGIATEPSLKGNRAAVPDWEGNVLLKTIVSGFDICADECHFVLWISMKVDGMSVCLWA